MSNFAWPWGDKRPTRITMNQDVKPDLPPSIYRWAYPDAKGWPIAVKGESYDCHCNNFGAVVAHIPVKGGFSEHLGVRPDEFTVTGWGPLTGAENIKEQSK